MTDAPLWCGPSAALLLELRAGAFELVASPALLAKLRGILGRERSRRHATQAEATAYVDLVCHEATALDDPVPSARPPSADPDDESLVGPRAGRRSGRSRARGCPPGRPARSPAGHDPAELMAGFGG
ncbi:MAG: hypothetical protein ACYDAN_00640 [Candidatus Limnocylindrales bacterium]